MFPSREVTVLSNGQAIQVHATFDPQGEGLAAASVGLAAGDRVLFATGGRHASIAVQRARLLSVEADGRTIQFRTQALTVAGALASAGIEVGPADRVYIDGHPTTARNPLSAGAFVSAKASAAQLPRGSVPGDPEGVETHLTIVRARPVTVFIDTLRVDISSSAPTVEGLLNELGMTVREGDLVRPALSTPVTAGMMVRLAKARTITVRLDGKEQSLYTLAETVSDVLRLMNVELGPEDVVSPAAESRIGNGMTIEIGLTRTVEEEIQTPLAPATVYETDPTLEPGKVKILAGTAGIRATRYRVTYKNGAEAGRVEIGSGVIQQPVSVRQISGPRPGGGSKPTLAAPDYNGPYSRTLTVWTTYYTAFDGGRPPDHPNFGMTASGARVDYGICAVDPSVIKLGTWMYIPKYGKCLAADTGGMVKGNHVDLGFPDSAVGTNPWGTQQLEIYIID
jgi:uncharacterized protein YabE (DUF348 family)/3D (Asp-Asp-Asp) domain-containing protein